MATTGYAGAIDTNDLLMGYIPEDVWGIPNAAAIQLIRLDSEGFSSTKSRTRPNEIDPAGQASAAITTKVESAGSLNFSVSVGTHNTLLASSLGGTWDTTIAVSDTTISADETTGTYTFNGTGIFTVVAGFAVGKWIRVSGFTTAANNGFFQIQTRTDNAITVIGDTALVDEIAGDTIVIEGTMLRNGKVFQSFSFEKFLAGTVSSGKFLHYKGCWPTGGSLDVGVGDYLKGTMAFLNKNEATGTATLGNPTTALTPPSGTVVDSIGGISGLKWKGAALDKVQKIGVKWNKEGARSQFAIGSSSAVGIGTGKLMVNGNFSQYFSDFDTYNDFINEVHGTLSFRAFDASYV